MGKAFSWKGRQYHIWKRTSLASSPWYFQIKRAGERLRVSLQTSDTTAAITKARLLLEAAQAGQISKMVSVISPAAAPSYSPLAKVVEVFTSTPLEIGATHRRGVVYSLASVLSKAGCLGGLETLSAGILTEATASAYFEGRLRAINATRDQAQQNRIKRSGNSIWCQAVCMFRPKLLAVYKRAGLVLPDLAPFLGVYQAERFSPGAVSYNPPGEKVIRNTLHAWVKITDRNTFLAVGLMLSCGLRKAEVSQATWGMFTRSHEGALFSGQMCVKSQSGWLVVPPLDPYWRVMMRRIAREGWRGRPEELVIQGGITERTEGVFRNVSMWLASLGWKTEKKSHALRAFSGSLVAMKFGIYRAQQWLRHSSVRVTEENYSHFINSRVFNPDRVRVRFAR